MKAKEIDNLFSDGAYVVGGCSSAHDPSLIRSVLFRYYEKNQNYTTQFARIWKRNDVYYYRVVETFEECNGFAYVREDKNPSPFRRSKP